MTLKEADLHCRSHLSDRVFTTLPICLHLPLLIVLLWYLSKGCFSSCQPQQVLVVVDLHTPKIPKYHNVYHVAHLSTSLFLTFSSGNYQVYLLKRCFTLGVVTFTLVVVTFLQAPCHCLFDIAKI